MTVTMLSFLRRRSDITMAEFISYYENTHMALIRDVAGPGNFPLSHTRRYVHRTEDDKSGSAPATILKGRQEDVPFDVVVEVTFADQAAMTSFFGKLGSPAGEKRIREDAERFMDYAMAVAVLQGEACVST